MRGYILCSVELHIHLGRKTKDLIFTQLYLDEIHAGDFSYRTPFVYKLS